MTHTRLALTCRLYANIIILCGIDEKGSYNALLEQCPLCVTSKNNPYSFFFSFPFLITVGKSIRRQVLDESFLWHIMTGSYKETCPLVNYN